MTTGEACVIDACIGEGGQGAVYTATYKNSTVAVKWYPPETASQLMLDRITRLVDKGQPSSQYLWPLDVVVWDKNKKCFGYVMPLCDKGFAKIPRLLQGDHDDTVTFHALATAGFEIADSFFKLHARGYSYGDISLGNLFIHPKTGKILICDNDNVSIDGDPSTIIGTPGFMAPEIGRGEASPSTETDLFSLAILLFHLLYRHHPLEGERFYSYLTIDEAYQSLFAVNPIYIFDPNNDANRPVIGKQDTPIMYHKYYPEYLKSLFERSFTKGLKPGGRIRETEWRAAMIRLRDMIVPCGTCRKENFFDVHAVKSCWKCSRTIVPPTRINIEGTVVSLPKGRMLYPHHVSRSQLYDFSAPVAEVVEHPVNKGVLGLKNLGSAKWVVELNNTLSDVPPGRSFAISSQVMVHFGEKDGVFRVVGH